MNIDLSYQQFLGSVYMVINVLQPQFLYRNGISIIQQQNPDFLLPVTVSSMNNKTVLMYKVVDQTENLRYMNTNATMQQCSTLIMNMIENLVRLKRMDLDYHKVCFDARTIYVNSATGKVYYTYLAKTDYSVTDMEIKQYLFGIINAFNISDDAQGKQKLLKCFTNEVTLEELYQRIHAASKGSGAGLNVSGVTNVTNVTDVQVQPQMQVLSLKLVQSSMPGVPEKIVLDSTKDKILIGRDSQGTELPDVVFPSECKGIGRKHARIEHRDGNYYLIDMNSVNHTFLNGKQLDPEQEYILQPGYEVIFTKTKPICYRVVAE